MAEQGIRRGTDRQGWVQEDREGGQGSGSVGRGDRLASRPPKLRDRAEGTPDQIGPARGEGSARGEEPSQSCVRGGSLQHQGHRLRGLYFKL